MADALVSMLNAYGYQPVFLPRTGIVPPELYNFDDHRLIRRGPLQSYMADPVQFKPTSGTLGNLDGRITSGKKTGAAVGLLTRALAVLGIGSLPKIDLSFTGAQDFVFSLTGVRYQSVDPSVLDQVIQSLKLPLSIPDAYVQEGALHIAYEYAYASELSLRRADGKEFDADVSGSIGQYVDLGAKGNVTVQNSSALTFSSPAGDPAAFAYKAGALNLDGTRWTFEPEVIMRSRDVAAPATRRPYLPAGNVVLIAEDGVP